MPEIPYQDDHIQRLLYKLVKNVAGSGSTPPPPPTATDVAAAFQTMTPTEKASVATAMADTSLMDFKGVYDPAANSPALTTTGPGALGDTYIVSTAGEVPGPGTFHVEPRDLIIYDATGNYTRVPAGDVTQTELDNEAALRVAGDATNASAITAEETRALAAEGVVASDLVSETNNRIAGDATNAFAITAEETRALAAEATIQSQLDSLTTGSEVVTDASRSLAATDYDKTLDVGANITLTGVALAPGRRIYGVVTGNFTVTFASTCFNANGATQISGDGAMFSIVIDRNGRPVWSSNRLV